MAPLQNAGIFLIQTLFDFYAMILLLRLLLQYLRVDYYNPLSQFIVKVTSPIVVPLRRIIPGYFGLDIATLAVLVMTIFIKTILVVLLSVHKFPGLGGLLIWTVADLLGLTIKLFFYAILVQVILNWVAPLSRSPLSFLLHQLTEPLLGPVRKRLYRWIPSLGAMDLSPIPVLIGLQLLNILIAQPLAQIGFQLCLR
jgi:YggT family protein